MKHRLTRRLGLAALCAGAGLLTGCAETHLRIQDDFGQAVTQDLAAQVADPDAGRNPGPMPASSGARAQGAINRYRSDTVIQPSGVGASGNSGYGENGAGAAAPATGSSPSAAPTAGP